MRNSRRPRERGLVRNRTRIGAFAPSASRTRSASGAGDHVRYRAAASTDPLIRTSIVSATATLPHRPGRPEAGQ